MVLFSDLPQTLEIDGADSHISTGHDYDGMNEYPRKPAR